MSGAFRPLGSDFACAVGGDYASETVIGVTPDGKANWALTCAHADDLVGNGLRAEALHFDLALVRLSGPVAPAPPLGRAKLGDRVIFYGTGGPCHEIRVADGTVVDTDIVHCYGPPQPGQAAGFCLAHHMGVAPFFAVKTDAGRGFSGGPVCRKDGGALTVVGIMRGVIECSASNPDLAGAAIVYDIETAIRVFYPDGDLSKEPSGPLFRPANAQTRQGNWPDPPGLGC
ncbi:MAG TPA: hypothetical protein VL993_04160 [Stellaceae bacterium]|nr:hypothetical protein [Stellaceae bacterium]